MAATTTSFSYLTPEQTEELLLAPLQQASTFMAQGSPIIVQSSGVPVLFPTIASMGTPTWHAEGSAIAEINATQGHVTLLPSTVQKTASITRVTRELLKQSAAIVDFGTALQTKMVTDLAWQLDQAFYDGAGAPAPTGILNNAYAQAAGTAIGTATTDDFFAADQLAGENNLLDSALKWAMSPARWVSVRALAGSDGQFYMQNSLTQSTAKQLLGHEVIVTNAMPDDTVALVDFSKVVVAIDTTADVQVLTEAYAAYDQVGIKAVARADVGVLYDGAVVTLEGITA